MQAEALVTRLDGDHAIVELARQGGGCGRCHDQGGCGGSAVMGQVFGPQCTRFRVVNAIGAQPGEAVIVELAEGTLLRVALMVYLLPVLLLAAGAFVGMILAPAGGDLAAALGGGLGLLAAIAVIVRFQAHRRSRIEPVLTRPAVAIFR